MCHRFRATFASRRGDAPAAEPWLSDGTRSASGYAEFVAEFAGASFAGGLYRVLDATTGPSAQARVDSAFPTLISRATPFVLDWLGRTFALDLQRVAEGGPLVLMLEPGTGEVLEVPTSFVEFHESELVDYADACLATDFFDAWSSQNPTSLPLGPDQCVGYRVPLFLGGRDDVSNLEVSDLDVYWAMCSQLWRGVEGLPPGTPIAGVSGP